LEDYSITLKARKISGENGFQIYFHNNGDNGRIRWDIGGYNNSTNEMNIGVKSESMKGAVEPGRWYDIKLEIAGNTVKGYLDGQLVQEVSAENLNIKNLLASASRDDKTGDIILKVVNASSIPVKSTVDLKGATSLTGTGSAMVLTSASPLDENTLDQPTKVSPKTEEVKFSGTTIARTFPGNSLTVIRLKTNK